MRYEKYKLTETVLSKYIPAEWDFKKISSLFLQRKEKVSDKDYSALSVAKIGVVPQLSDAVKSNNSENRKLVRAGDFVINSRSDRKGSSGVSQQDGSVSLINIVLTPRKELNSRYVHYLLRSQPFSEEYYRCGRGIVSDLWTTRYSEMKNILIPVPSRVEQDQIVRYLDWRLSKINELIIAKKKQITLLTARKHSIVSDVITHGLNSKVSMKYSGVDWLGNIPAHWKIIKLRGILSSFSQKGYPDMQLLSVVREKGVIVRDIEKIETNHNFIPDDLSGYKVVHKNQFVVNKMKAWQGSYGVSQYEGIVSPAYFVFNVSFENLEYFHYAIRSKVYVNFFAQASDGIRVGQWDLSMNKMKNIPFILPPNEEQEEIVAYIPKRIENTERAIAIIQSQIDKLNELHTRLIADVVTGQLDVRSIEIPDFEMFENLDYGVDDVDEEVEEKNNIQEE